MQPDVKIAQAKFDNRMELADLHFRCLPNDFLPSLGIDFLCYVYYPAALKSSNAITYIALLQNVIVGFVTITRDSAAYSNDIIRGNWTNLAHYALRTMRHNPSYIIKSLKVLWASAVSAPDSISAEISFIAVHPNHQNQGIGKSLVLESLTYLKHHGISQCRTKTLSTNHIVIGMYNKLGWSIRNNFQFIGKNYVTLIFNNSAH